MSLPSISVIVVNLNGKSYLESCLQSLSTQDYPAEQVEIILVDNGSQDGSVEFVASRFPAVHIIRNEQNTGFAPAVNQGAHAASGNYLALINNDARADAAWLTEMVAALQRHREQHVVCVGAKMLDWEGNRIDFAGSGVSFYGFGHQFFHHVPPDALDLQEHEILFACGGAMLVERDVFLQTGGFDDTYFAYFEDIDFGWRLWVCGYRVMFAPAACVYHVHHGSSRRFDKHRINVLLERNALMTMMKNYDDEHLYRLLGPALLLVFHRMIAYADDQFPAEIDWKSFGVCATAEQARGDATRQPQPLAVSPMTMSYVAAMRELMQHLPRLWQKRQHIQAQRKRSDQDILPLFRQPLGPHYCNELLLKQTLADIFNVQEFFAGTRMHSILIISTDPLYENLAGPGIRVMEMARYLAQSCSVVLAAPRRADIQVAGVDCVTFQYDDLQTLESLVNQADVIILQGFTLNECPFIAHSRKILVIDLYDPFHLENLEHFKQDDLEYVRAVMSNNVQILNQLLGVGDFFICASERQRDLWLGMLGSVGRLAPENYAHDPTFHSLIDIVPFGIDPQPPVKQKQVLKGVVPGIGEQDTVVLWGGGVWDWLDPVMVIYAMEQVRRQRSDIKLYFMGFHHPNPVDVPKMRVYERIVALVDELNLHDTVLFNDGWVSYQERANYFLEADIGVSAHLEHIETRFAFRTRMLDYIWAGLPMVVTAGDTLADTVRQHNLGLVVDIGDSAGFAQALLTLAAQPDARQQYASAFAEVAQCYAWPQALKPLIAFCQNPRCAPDRQRLTLVDTYQRRMRELEDIIARKNEHIAYLEGLIQRFESGKVMRGLRVLQRLLRR